VKQNPDELQSIIDKLQLRLQGVDVFNVFPLYIKTINQLEKRIDELKKTKTT